MLPYTLILIECPENRFGADLDFGCSSNDKMNETNDNENWQQFTNIL